MSDAVCCETYPVRLAAKKLGVGKTTLYEAIGRGEVPNAGVGTVKRVPKWFIDSKLNPPSEVPR